MKSKKVLFIVEGEVEEVNLLGNSKRGLLSLINCNYEIVSFKNTIYELYEAYKAGEYDDLVAYLRSEKGLLIEDGVLSKNAFAAVYLIFDYEPQCHKYSDDIILDILNVFNDETRLGKIYINYPMIEATYHLTSFHDKNYFNKKISLNNCNGKIYKKIVKKESFINKKKMYKRCFQYIIKYNYEKALYVSKRKKDIRYDLILKEQIKLKNKNNEIYVLSTFPLLLFDYNSELTMKLIENINI